MKRISLKKISILGWVIIVFGILFAGVSIFAIDATWGEKIGAALFFLIVAFSIALLISKIQRVIKKVLKGGAQEPAQESHSNNDELVENIISAYFCGEYTDIDDKLGMLSKEEQQEVIYCALNKIIANYQESGEVSDNDENHFCRFAEHFNIQHSELYEQPFYQELVKLLVINDLLHGKLPTRVKIPSESILINLQKDEHVLWVFTDVQLFELTKKITRVGTASGWSGRVLSGLYYKKSSFRGESIVSQKMEYIATGLVYITDKNIYFNAPERGMRIPYTKVVSYIPYEDGLGILRDGTTSKPLCMKYMDGWFAYNFVKNVTNITNK